MRLWSHYTLCFFFFLPLSNKWIDTEERYGAYILKLWVYFNWSCGGRVFVCAREEKTERKCVWAGLSFIYWWVHIFICVEFCKICCNHAGILPFAMFWCDSRVKHQTIHSLFSVPHLVCLQNPQSSQLFKRQLDNMTFLLTWFSQWAAAEESVLCVCCRTKH